MPTASAIRYAKAVFQLAVERDELENWLEDLTQLADSITNSEFSEVLSAPRVPSTQKERVIREALGASVGPLALNLMFLLTGRGATHALPEIADRYQEMLDAHMGIERAEVVSAVPLDDAQRDSVADMLARTSGKEIRLSARVDPEILGGMVIRVGDRVMDGSARTRLQSMRRDMAQRH